VELRPDMSVERRREGGRRMRRERTLVCSTTRVRLQLIACTTHQFMNMKE